MPGRARHGLTALLLLELPLNRLSTGEAGMAVPNQKRGSASRGVEAREGHAIRLDAAISPNCARFEAPLPHKRKASRCRQRRPQNAYVPGPLRPCDGSASGGQRKGNRIDARSAVIMTRTEIRFGRRSAFQLS